MTLIVAVSGKSEIVMAGERLCLLGNGDGQYRTDFPKIRTVQNGRWAVGLAGERSGHTLLEDAGKACEASPYAPMQDTMKQHWKVLMNNYKQDGQFDELAFLFAGVENSVPILYVANFGRGEVHGLTPLPEGRIATGISKHGALYLLHSFHSKEMSTAELVFLAYFAIDQAIKHDNRVREPIDVYLIRDAGVRQLGASELSGIDRMCKRAARGILSTIKRTSRSLSNVA